MRLPTYVLGALTPRTLDQSVGVCMERPTCADTMRFLSVKSVFTQAALLVLLSFTSLRAVGK